MAQAQQEVSFAEVTPVQEVRSDKVAVTVRISGAEVDIYNDADAATVETVLRILKSCRVTSPELIGFILPAATPTYGAGLTGWLPWFSSNSIWIHSPTPCSCFAVDAGIALSLCTGKETDLCCFTSGWNPAASNDPGREVKPEHSLLNSTAGSWKG